MWFKREPPKAPTNSTHAPLNHVFSTPQHDPNLTPIKQETSGARPSQPRLTLSFALLHPSPTPRDGILIRCFKEKKREGSCFDEDTFDAHIFKTPFHEHFFNSNVASKPIIPDTRFKLEEDRYPQIQQQIELHG
ncbi:hypothetical protein PIB30_098088 [Stylosanthes scabra]|uniref:Uncharacterized protein n=1 Tax=Stylosanthes scabra TaxID=79078 RepID=A0ABU6YU68_9FABA|nr:hypothetical protein [Stylosanthes scabra]